MPYVKIYFCVNSFINYLNEKSFHSNPNDKKASKLHTLNLNFNNIIILHDDQFKQLLALEYISMRNNKLILISSSLFSNNIIIKYIDLYANNIVDFDFRLDVLKLLWHLNLGYNKLSTLKEKVFIDYLVKNIKRRIILRIANNNFKCDCSMAWIRELDHSNIAIYTSKKDLCSVHMSMNVTVGCFMRQELGVKCGKINIEKCIKGKLFNYITYI